MPVVLSLLPVAALHVSALVVGQVGQRLEKHPVPLGDAVAVVDELALVVEEAAPDAGGAKLCDRAGLTLANLQAAALPPAQLLHPLLGVAKRAERVPHG